MSIESVIVSGPSGCGKTRNAELILKHYGLDMIYDGYNGEPLLSHGVLALTNRLDLPRSVPFEQVMSDIQKGVKP